MDPQTGFVNRGDVAIAYEEFGRASDPAIVLICGAATTREWWDTEFCLRLVAGDRDARRVIRYDLRDSGQSTTGRAGSVDYSSDDLVGDLAALIEARDAAPAHVVGISFGGGLAQQLALQRPELIATLTLMSTTLAGPGSVGSGTLPPPSPEVAASFEAEQTEPDWTDVDAVARSFIDAERLFGGTIPVDEARIRRIARAVVARAGDQSASSNHFLVPEGARHREDIVSIEAPTLVIHGSDDPLFPLPHGARLAETIPGARLLVIPGMGHQNPPPPTWDAVIPAIFGHTAEGGPSIRETPTTP